LKEPQQRKGEVDFLGVLGTRSVKLVKGDYRAAISFSKVSPR
jgi:hypothetical protein